MALKLRQRAFLLFLYLLWSPSVAFVSVLVPSLPSKQRSGQLLAAKNTDVSSTLFRAASQRSVPSSELLPLLEKLDKEHTSTSTPIPRALVEGTYELIYSSAVANLPLGLGSILDGYLPNKEIINFDLKGGLLSLRVETLPFLPSIDIEGENLTYDDATSNLVYTVKGKNKSSAWTVLYADETLLAAKSSVTGLNVIKKL